MREWEQATWASGQTEDSVIRRVGAGIARHALRLTGEGGRILILAGKGHNGDDAREAEPHLQSRAVEVLTVTDPSALDQLDSALARGPDLVIDGLFGIGLNRPLDESWKQLIERLNVKRLPVLAVDLPSGLNADTGEHFGAAVRATVTLTVGAPKAGLITPGAWPYVGRLEVTGDVGLVPCPVASERQWTTGADFRRFPPPRLAATHKGTYGHVAIVAGSPGYHGAAVLAARGAQRAQPGLITLLVPPEAYLPAASQLQAAMVSAWTPATKLPADYDAILLGPGLAAPEVRDRAQALTRAAWRDASAPVVVDASALDWVPIEPPPRNSVRILTPHPGEAARLLRTTVNQVQSDRAAAVRNISKRYGNTWVVLKGHQTVIGRSTGEIFLNSSGNPHLAQGGTGDLLGGYLAGLLAQAELRADVLKTIRWAVWEHGAAADRLQRRRSAWTIEDLQAELGSGCCCSCSCS